MDDVYQYAEVASQAVSFVHHHDIKLPTFSCLEQCTEAGTFFNWQSAGYFVLVDIPLGDHISLRFAPGLYALFLDLETVVPLGILFFCTNTQILGASFLLFYWLWRIMFHFLTDKLSAGLRVRHLLAFPTSEKSALLQGLLGTALECAEFRLL